ncbi:hypothetical protein FRX31_015234 [Thalictrum thalictroides]|uniref:Reverse transcriptase zinc-binding domain-containing protein n=1 Tax=Thalictrum thalictroides TaxID=46969 RepID=A0A7J6WCS6_THATH|nr:hypothetical protein FRX31_015234 [Thalictrum thalictroides]
MGPSFSPWFTFIAPPTSDKPQLLFSTARTHLPSLRQPDQDEGLRGKWRCGLMNESITYILLHCPFSLEIWSSMLGTRMEVYARIFEVDKVEEWLISWPKARYHNLGGLLWGILPYAICWMLWKARNNLVFQQDVGSAVRICKDIKGLLWHWVAISPERRHHTYGEMLANWDLVLSESWI